MPDTDQGSDRGRHALLVIITTFILTIVSKNDIVSPSASRLPPTPERTPTVKLALPLAAAMLLTLAACAGNQPTAASAPAGTSLQPSAALAADAVVADVGNGRQTPASLSIHLRLADVKAYALQASSPGQAAKTLDDMTHLRFYLVPSATGTPPTALAGDGFTYALTGTNRTNGYVDVTFTNVAANDTGESYYVAAAGFDAATTTAAHNITNAGAPLLDGTEGRFYVSTSGGSPAGAVRVTPVTYAISGTGAIGVPLKLLDAVSPVIESSIDLTAGDEVTGAPEGEAN